jgi:glycosyltransferase involved in cell wall biosynthesis
VILSASKRVKEIATRFGIESGKNAVSYIGTDFPQMPPRDIPDDGVITIAYLGYARQHKGFFFFLNALEEIDAATASKMRVKFIVSDLKPWIKEHIYQIGFKFHSITIIDGFTKKTLKRSLSGVDLGIVPVIWEDCLPQVAIEMAAMGIPVLASDLGGASELCPSPDFTFEGGNTKDFIAKLTAIIDCPGMLSGYWQHYKGLVSMQQHLRELEGYYTKEGGQNHEFLEK